MLVEEHVGEETIVPRCPLVSFLEGMGIFIGNSCFHFRVFVCIVTRLTVGRLVVFVSLCEMNIL